MLNNNNIKITLLDLSDQNRAVLEFYFNSVGKKLYTIVEENEADAFIIDYDYPNAKNVVSQRLTSSDKPIVILSVKKQKLDSTIWLAKPLSTDALTKAAEKLHQMTAVTNESKVASVALAAPEPAPIAAEIATTKTSQTAIKETAIIDDEIKIPLLDEELSEDNPNNIFDMLDTEDLKLDEDKKIEARLTMKSTEALVSATMIANNVLDSDDKYTESEEKSHIEFAKILLDDEKNEATDIESEGGVDALLEALILGEGTQDTDTDSMKIIEQTGITPEEIKEKNVDLFEADFDVEADEKATIKEDNSILDEDFTLHDDLTPSEEDTYAKTLNVDFDNPKDEASTTQIEQVSDDLVLESYADQVTAEANSNKDSNELLTLEPQFDLESNIDSKEESETELNEEVSSLIFDDTENENADSADTDNVETDNVETDKVENVVNDEVDSNLDDLLNEISDENDEVDIDEQQKISEIESFITKTTLLEDDSNNIEDAYDDAADEGTLDDNDSILELQSLLNEVREEADNPNSNKSFDEGSVNIQYQKTKAEKRWMQLCGNNENISANDDISKISFSADTHLLSALLKEIELTKGSEKLYRIKYNELIIVLDHSERNIYCNLPIQSDEFSELCFSEVNNNNLKIHDLDYSEVRLYRSKIQENPGRAHTIESFIWSMSLLTSRGRLPEGTDINKRIGLKIWPNLTRVELIPHAMHIAAVLNKNPGSLLEISEWLKIKQQYVFAFYNATLSLDMLELDSSKLKEHSFNFALEDSEDTKERGFFARLLKRLKS